MADKICPACKKSQTKKFANRCEFCGQTFMEETLSGSPTNLVKYQPSTVTANPSKSSLLQEQKIPSSQFLNDLELSANERLFGEICFDLGFITVEDVAQAINDQKVGRAIGEKKPIGAYLFERKKLTREQISQILKIQAQLEKIPNSLDNQIQNNPATLHQAENNELTNHSPIVVSRSIEVGQRVGSSLPSIALLLFVGYLLINSVANAKHETDTYYSLSALLCMAANRPSIEVISTRVLDSMKKHFSQDRSTDDIEIMKISLRHKNGNKYIGVVEANKAGIEGKFTVYVTSDGESVSWETQKGWHLKFLF